jgi:hypothetical protein
VLVTRCAAALTTGVGSGVQKASRHCLSWCSNKPFSRRQACSALPDRAWLSHDQQSLCGGAPWQGRDVAGQRCRIYAFGKFQENDLLGVKTEAEKMRMLAALNLVECIATIAPRKTR